MLYLWVYDRELKAMEGTGRIASPLLTTFSMALGVATFGWKGAIIGPLLMCLLIVVTRHRMGNTATIEAPRTSP